MFRSLILLILLCTSLTTMALSYTVEISEETLQKEVSAMMPLQKKMLFFLVTLSNPEVELIQGSNEIGIFTRVTVIAPAGMKGSGSTRITGSLSYQAESNEFFFKNPMIKQLEIDQVPEELIPNLKSIIQLIARKMLAVHPVYKLKDNNIKHKFAKAMLQSVSIKDKKLLLELSML